MFPFFFATLPRPLVSLSSFLSLVPSLFISFRVSLTVFLSYCYLDMTLASAFLQSLLSFSALHRHSYSLNYFFVSFDLIYRQSFHVSPPLFDAFLYLTLISVFFHSRFLLLPILLLFFFHLLLSFFTQFLISYLRFSSPPFRVLCSFPLFLLRLPSRVLLTPNLSHSFLASFFYPSFAHSPPAHSSPRPL